MKIRNDLTFTAQLTVRDNDSININNLIHNRITKNAGSYNSVATYEEMCGNSRRLEEI